MIRTTSCTSARGRAWPVVLRARGSNLGPQCRRTRAALRQLQQDYLHRHPHRLRDGAHAANRRDRQTRKDTHSPGELSIASSDGHCKPQLSSFAQAVPAHVGALSLHCQAPYFFPNGERKAYVRALFSLLEEEEQVNEALRRLRVV
jgi:hypothetical protein